MYKQASNNDRKKPQSSLSDNRKKSAEKVNFVQRNKEIQSKKKLAEKNNNLPPINKGTNIIPKQTNNKTIPQKIQNLEKIVEKLTSGVNNPQIQQKLLEQIKGIKSQLKQIKEQMGIKKQGSKNQTYQNEQNQSQVEQNIYEIVPRNEPQQFQSTSQKNPIKNSQRVNQQQNFQSKNLAKSNFQLYDEKNKKEMIDIGKIQPYMKQFKLDAAKNLQPYYTGYNKKSSKPVIIKYCSQDKTMDQLISIYQKLWKNIVKAKKICINKIYDLNEPLASYIMVLDMNRFELKQIDMPPNLIIKDLIRALQFFHECGFLYRNIHPKHVMMSFESNIVLIDLKRIKKYIDMKGKLIEIRSNINQEPIDQFVSNSRLRSLPEGRKDDLQCLGYLALYLLEGKLPWNMNNIVQIRSKLTLQQLYGKYGGLLQYMITIHKMSVEEVPNYDLLCGLLSE